MLTVFRMVSDNYEVIDLNDGGEIDYQELRRF